MPQIPDRKQLNSSTLHFGNKNVICFLFSATILCVNVDIARRRSSSQSTNKNAHNASRWTCSAFMACKCIYFAMNGIVCMTVNVRRGLLWKRRAMQLHMKSEMHSQLSHAVFEKKKLPYNCFDRKIRDENNTTHTEEDKRNGGSAYSRTHTNRIDFSWFILCTCDRK